MRLGITEMGGHPGVYEFHYSAAGRATFHYGDPVIPGEVHVVWRRRGTRRGGSSHEIYQEP